ncbi:vWA domain-containing protein [Ruminococcus sp. XPD3002]|uniref:vWA domain-containing protein n=1 Tax=Ruminococcus sp. XPD3002 TaxID=1452269 RepID=UPI000920424A|nr:Uncharacterized conserved protein YegL, contains vWA domain of TerY type [Ruminococcus flavefaciens]
MKNNITELVLILDRSGSMAGLESDTIGGFNSMIEKQKKLDGKCYVSTVIFDNESEVLHDRIDLAEVPKMTDKEYFPRGCTALLDAIGGAIHHIENIHKYARKEDVPEHTLFCITTDGMENASHKYDLKKVRKMIEAKKEIGWEFIFIGANIDAVSAAADIGISEDRAVNYTASACGTASVYDAMSAVTSSVRGCVPIERNWKKKVK